MVMVHRAAQHRAAQGPALVLADQEPVTKIRAIMEVIINSLAMEASGRITSRGI